MRKKCWTNDFLIPYTGSRPFLVNEDSNTQTHTNFQPSHILTCIKEFFATPKGLERHLRVVERRIWICEKLKDRLEGKTRSKRGLRREDDTLGGLSSTSRRIRCCIVHAPIYYIILHVLAHNIHVYVDSMSLSIYFVVYIAHVNI